VEAIFLVVVAGVLGGLFRAVLGFLGEADPGEEFSPAKAARSILRAVIGGGILAYFLGLDPKATFFAAFASDIGLKNLTDMIRNRRGE
jgi:hypothetical protein